MSAVSTNGALTKPNEHQDGSQNLLLAVPFPPHPKLVLYVTEHMPKVNVEKFTIVA